MTRRQDWLGLTFTCKLSIVLATALVIAHHTHNVLTILILGSPALIVRALLGDITGWDGSGDSGATMTKGRAGTITTGSSWRQATTNTKGMMEGQRGHGHGGDAGDRAGAGHQVGVPPDGGGGRH